MRSRIEQGFGPGEMGHPGTRWETAKNRTGATSSLRSKPREGETSVELPRGFARRVGASGERSASIGLAYPRLEACSRKPVVSAKTNGRFRLHTDAASGNVRSTQRGNPMRTPKGNLRRVGVKPGKGSATNPPEGTPQGGRGESPARTGLGRGSPGFRF
jgi:hypothetical protein